MSETNWVVYILQCNDDTLYTGITTNLERRINQHENGKGAKYTKGRSPFKIIYIQICNDKSSALKRELEIKKLKKSEKLNLKN